MESGKRAYNSGLRADQARQTRRQIVDAAAALFAESGYGATSIDAIAERAGVSRKTVFTAVGGKPALIKLAYDWAVVGDDEPVMKADRAEILALVAEADAHRMLERYAGVIASTLQRVAPLFLALRGAADGDDEARALYEQVLAERVLGMRAPAKKLAAMGALRPGLTEKRAADLLYLHIDPAAYDVLVLQRGWSIASFRDFTATSLATHLLGRVSGGPAGN